MSFFRYIDRWVESELNCLSKLPLFQRRLKPAQAVVLSMWSRTGGVGLGSTLSVNVKKQTNVKHNQNITLIKSCKLKPNAAK